MLSSITWPEEVKMELATPDQPTTSIVSTFQEFRTRQNTLHLANFALRSTVRPRLCRLCSIPVTPFRPSARLGNIDSNQNANNMRNCWLLLLADQYGASEYVRNIVAAYFNRLTEIGVAGIRIDAAKHMWPDVK